MTCLISKTDVVQYVGDRLLDLKHDSALTMIITHEPSGVYSASCVIDGQSEDTEPHMDRYYYSELSII